MPDWGVGEGGEGREEVRALSTHANVEAALTNSHIGKHN